MVCGSQCKSCGAYPKSGTTFQHLSPDAVKVSQHLTNITDQSVIVAPNDNLCYSCYRAYCTIIQSLKLPEGSNVTLQQSILEWVSICKEGSTEKLTMVILHAVIYVAQDLLIRKHICFHGSARYF